jgi:GTP cyclohydrolase II
MVKLQAEAYLPTQYGQFKVMAFSEEANDPMPMMVLHHDKYVDALPYVRLHSECMTGDTFGSVRCDCGEQLHSAMEIIAEKGGYLIYLRQEGRGIGLINKLKAYQLQENGLDTLQANVHLGFKGDEREYAEAVEVLKILGQETIYLITNNPEKVTYLENHGIHVQQRIPLIIPPHSENKDYLNVKKHKMGHWL